MEHVPPCLLHTTLLLSLIDTSSNFQNFSFLPSFPLLVLPLPNSPGHALHLFHTTLVACLNECTNNQRVFDRAGLDPDGTFLPPAINPRFCGHTPDQSMNASNEECRLGLFGAMQGLLDKVSVPVTMLRTQQCFGSIVQTSGNAAELSY